MTSRFAAVVLFYLSQAEEMLNVGQPVKWRLFNVTISTSLVFSGGYYACLCAFVTIEQRPRVVGYFQKIGSRHLVGGVGWGNRHQPSSMIASDQGRQRNAVVHKKGSFLE